jgi:hypothetical protein
MLLDCAEPYFGIIEFQSGVIEAHTELVRITLESMELNVAS